MRWLAILLLAALGSVAPAAGAQAHAFLDKAAPPVGGTVASAPAEVRLFFSKAIEPRFSGIELTTADGQLVKTAPATVTPADPMQSVLALPPLASGRYRVRWYIVSVDTHSTEGNYTFEIRP
jgi:methionine-rich copper-binding protein CopC